MRSLGLIGLVLAVLAVTAITSPWVALLLTQAGWSVSLGRVYDRVFEVLLVVALLVAWRRLGLGGPQEIGFRREGWGRQLGRGILIGAIGIGAGLLCCVVWGALVPTLRYPALKAVRKAALGILGAGAIGVGEEALFRGVLLRRFTRDAGLPIAIATTTAIYAAVHLIRTGKTPGPITWSSGIERTLALFSPLADPAALPTLVGLAGFGMVLAAARLRSGTLWLPIGIHAVWVTVFRVGRLLFVIRPKPEWLVGGGWPPLVGGLAGWVAVAVTGLLVVRLARR